jgi:hypothetical protein
MGNVIVKNMKIFLALPRENCKLFTSKAEGHYQHQRRNPLGATLRTGKSDLAQGSTQEV